MNPLETSYIRAKFYKGKKNVRVLESVLERSVIGSEVLLDKEGKKYGTMVSYDEGGNVSGLEQYVNNKKKESLWFYRAGISYTRRWSPYPNESSLNVFIRHPEYFEEKRNLGLQISMRPLKGLVLEPVIKKGNRGSITSVLKYIMGKDMFKTLNELLDSRQLFSHQERLYWKEVK